MVDKFRWHPWFAWRPVKCEGKWAWLELILRKWYSGGSFGEARWMYRFDDIDLGYA